MTAVSVSGAGKVARASVGQPSTAISYAARATLTVPTKFPRPGPGGGKSLWQTPPPSLIPNDVRVETAFDPSEKKPQFPAVVSRISTVTVCSRPSIGVYV